MELELVPTFEEKLAAFATAFVPTFVKDICKLAKEAKENPVIVHLLDTWYDNNARYEREYRRSILESLTDNIDWNATLSAMTDIYHRKASAAHEILMDYFMKNGFKDSNIKG